MTVNPAIAARLYSELDETISPDPLRQPSPVPKPSLSARHTGTRLQQARTSERSDATSRSNRTFLDSVVRGISQHNSHPLISHQLSGRGGDILEQGADYV